MSYYLPSFLCGNVSDTWHREVEPKQKKVIRVLGGRSSWKSACHCHKEEGSMQRNGSRNLHVCSKSNQEGINRIFHKAHTELDMCIPVSQNRESLENTLSIQKRPLKEACISRWLNSRKKHYKCTKNVLKNSFLLKNRKSQYLCLLKKIEFTSKKSFTRRFCPKWIQQ